VQLTEWALGVTPTGPGYATWSIRPHPGDLTWAQGAVPTRFGTVTAAWSRSRDGDRFLLDARTPAGTSGTISVPADSRAVVIVNGHVAWDRGRSKAFHATAADGYVDLLVHRGGNYHITVGHR
jgi:hypothetical protein